MWAISYGCSTIAFKPVFFSLLIERCSFINSYHIGDGGGLTIFSEVRNSEVKILDSNFSNNSAVKGIGTVKGRGGGLFIKSESLSLIINGSIFQENKASDLGVAIYTTEGVNVSLSNCTFQYHVDPNAPIQQSLLFVSGRVMKFLGLFRVFNQKPESYVGLIEIFYMGQAENVDIETYCPKWYNHITEYTYVSTESHTIPDLKYKCTPCSDSYYTVGMQSNTLFYTGKGNISLPEKSNRNHLIDTCIPCPYGALCTGNNVMPRSNYWGYWHDGELKFQQCPAGYCCSGSDSSTCNVYDYCAGNKTGILCGACQEGFSVSILTGACTLDSQCGQDQWFWLIAVLAMLAYAVWYTLKDDIFAIVFDAITFLKMICKRSHSEFINVPVEMKPANKERPSIASQMQESGIHYNIGCMQNDGKEVEGRNYQEDVDKGYFGIVTYYVQMAAVIMIKIEFSDIDTSEPFLDKMVNNIGRFLNLELTQMSFDVCPVLGLTTVGKHLYKLVFLVGIYVSWAGSFIIIIALIALLDKKEILHPTKIKLEVSKVWQSTGGNSG